MIVTTNGDSKRDTLVRLGIARTGVFHAHRGRRPDHMSVESCQSISSGSSGRSLFDARTPITAFKAHSASRRGRGFLQTLLFPTRPSLRDLTAYRRRRAASETSLSLIGR